MNRINYLPLLAVLLAACSATTEVPQETEAVRDFIAAADLIEVRRASVGRNMNHSRVSDEFAMIRGDKKEYLAEFAQRCYNLKRDFTRDTIDEHNPMVDKRHDPNNIYAKQDTIRGCRIAKLYELTPEQAQELKRLGDAPGEEVYIPPKEES